MKPDLAETMLAILKDTLAAYERWRTRSAKQEYDKVLPGRAAWRGLVWDELTDIPWTLRPM